MSVNAKRAMLIAAGWAFMLVGLTGFLLPIIPGVPFLLLGLLILSGEYVWAERLLGKIRRHFPKMTRTAERQRDRWTSAPPRQAEAGD